jgi:endonuclease-3
VTLKSTPDGKAITRRLLKHYPDPKLALRFKTPLQLLVATILSAQCTDARVNVVTAVLFKKYNTARDYARAVPSVFEKEIRSTGFYKNKARSVINCCKALDEGYGGRVPADVDALIALPGVGRKTANMVLGNAFGIPAIAVDTHVLRVSNRLGLVDTADAARAETTLVRQVPQRHWTAFANAMILHGRRVCTARKPDCCACPLFDLCGWREKPGCD